MSRSLLWLLLHLLLPTVEGSVTTHSPNITTESMSTFTESSSIGHYSNTSLKELAKRTLLWKVGTWMHQYYLPMLVPVGLVGNVLSFLVSMRLYDICCN